jgi:predicted acyltransferase
MASLLGAISIGSGPETVSLKQWLFTHVYLPWLTPEAASLAYALTYVLLWLVIMDLFYRRRVFIKI